MRDLELEKRIIEEEGLWLQAAREAVEAHDCLMYKPMIDCCERLMNLYREYDGLKREGKR